MNRRAAFVLRAQLLALACASGLAGQQTANHVSLRLLPSEVRLDRADDRAQIVVLATTAQGFVVDVTAEAVFELGSGGLVTLHRDGRRAHLAAGHDGDGEVVATFGSLTARAPLHVHGAGITPPPSFANDVLPILTHAGCNAGSCHGAASGKNGFALSLFAYDPSADHRVLTRELRSRRVDLARPEQSMLLQKGSGQVPHQGGKRLPADSDEYRQLLAWIRSGAVGDVATAAPLQRLELEPANALLLAGSTLPLVLRAIYADGSDRDVTSLAIWSSNDDGTAAIARDGRITAGRAGEAALLARFGGFAALAQVQVLADDRPWTWPATPAANFVDEHLHRKLRQARVAPAPLCSDEVFVRRVHLDLLGVLPTPDEVRAFLADAATDKRERLVDALLRRPEWAAVQAMAWADTLLVDGERMEPKGAHQLATWLRDRFAAGAPFDAIVRELLTASGPSYGAPAANYWLAADQPHLLGEHTAQNFLGIRLQCAQCHNHPFENWTMDDYYGFAAFFAQLAKKRGEDGAEWVVWNRGSGDVRNKRTGQVAVPKFLGGAKAQVPNDGDRRAVLAQWLTAADNPWFAKNVANRVFARLFGRGLVEPVDDVRIGNPPSHPELLQALAELLVGESFDLRALYRALCTSRTYQTSQHPQSPPAALFAGNLVRRLAAEPLLDAIGAATGVPTKYPGLPLGEPASAIANGRSGVRFLEVFGRPARESACTCDRRDEPTLGQTLHLVNGDTVAGKVAAKDGRLARLLAAETSDDARMDELWLASYARLPRADERAHVAELLATAAGEPDAKQRATAVRAVWQDVFWAMLNSHEFLFQH
ncbi:MAG: DUF1553 domain-containing protein [Planctomycetota bacterium]